MINIRSTIESAFEHLKKGNLHKAEQLCKEVLSSEPRNTDALHILGIINRQSGNYDGAIQYLSDEIRITPDSARACYVLGTVYQDKQNIDEAESWYVKAIRINPDFAEAYRNLGMVLQVKNQIDEAITLFHRAVSLKPDFPEAYNNLGTAYAQKNLLDEAIAFYRNALQYNPEYAHAYYNLGNALKQQGKLQDAIESYFASLKINPHSAMTLNNLGTLLKDMGHLREAADCLKNAISIDPGCSYFHSNFLFLLHYDPLYTAESIFSEHLIFGHKFEQPLQDTMQTLSKKLKSDDHLQIGYVSPDFKNHSVAFFLEPVLAGHNRDKVEVYCYSDVPTEDEVTQRMKGYADHWQSIVSLSDEQVADLIRNDGIDILVDLAGHTAHNRLLVFARKPAPVQVSWIGYPATTGLSAMDYKIVDNYTDPPGMTEHLYTEKLIRMPESFLCYLPAKDSPEVGPLPALTAGHITFGSFNNFPKVTPEMMELWSDILKAVPGSRLVMKAKSLSDISTREYVTETFKQKGIPAERIELLEWEPSSRGHLEIYNRIDIALDTFPYHGTTTTCEALWMGVPVITLAGATHASRVGVSLLSNAGVPELVAQTPDEYRKKASNLAADADRLQSLRRDLRSMVQRSPLTNAERFIHHLEELYRIAWHDWFTGIDSVT